MRERGVRALLGALCVAGLLAGGACGRGDAGPAKQEGDSGAAPAVTQEVVKKGLRVEFSVIPTGTGDAAGQLMEGQTAEVRFRVTDAQTGAPVTPLEPAVWIARENQGEDLACRERIGRYLRGMLSHQADVDLNKYFIMILNHDRTIAVVDPLLGVSGITQLYAMVALEAPGDDWARSADDKRMFVSQPGAGKLAVVDLDEFEVIESLEVGSRPVRVVLQPDGKYLWVGNDAEDEAESGVTVVDAQAHRVVARIPTGAGHHEIAFSDDSLTAFVTNSGSDTVSVIDVQKLEKRKDLPTGDTPLAVEFSKLGGAAYVAARDGAIAVVDAKRLEVTRRLETAPGLVSLRLDPSGRWAFGALLEDDAVVVFDASNGSLAHRLEVGDRPHQFAFTTTYAYVRHLGTSNVVLVPLSQLGQENEPGLQEVAFGDRAPGDYPYPATADAISPTGEWTAVVTANPVDKMVYYYMEGMIAPMGSYGTYGRVPRAVGVVDRSVRETEKGVYAAKFRVPGSGEFNVSMVLDQPFVDHCFAFSAVPDPTRKRRSEHAARIEFLNDSRAFPAGQPVPVRFSLVDPNSEEPLAGIQDVVVLATRPPGAWQERTRAKPLEGGVYEASVPADQPGAYYVSVSVPSLDLDFTDLAYMTFVAEAGGATAEGEK